MSRVDEYSRIQSEYATYHGTQGVRDAIQETEQSLRPLRPKVAPADDLEKERRAISKEVSQNMFLVQFALFLLVVSMICYAVLPQDWAHGITFLLLCVGIATGFFLRR